MLDEGESERLASELVARRRGPDGLDAGTGVRPYTSYNDIASVLDESVLQKCANAGIEFGVTSTAFRSYLSVAMPERHLLLGAEMVVVREDDEVRVMEWHDL